MNIVEEALDAASGARGQLSGDKFGGIPFASVLSPFVALARSRLGTLVDISHGLIAPEASTSLERSLLELLSAVCGQVLELSFSLLRFRQTPVERLGEATGIEPRLTDNGERIPVHQSDLYEEFNREARRHGLLRLFAEYPALATVVESCITGWVEANAEFLERLRTDCRELASVFNHGHAARVTDVQTGLSDRHNRGRTVMTVQFSSGLRLVYKPKDLRSDETYFSLLRWLNANGAPLEFRAVRVLRKEGYGWTEFAEKRPCQTADQAHRYYQRAGQLLCLCYLLAGSDCHFDNLIACGEHPVLVDTEMLFQPALAGKEAAHSVLRTGLLPKPAAEAWDFSGLGCVANRVVQLRIPEWLAPNTDAMALRFRPAVLQPRSNVVSLGGLPLSPLDFVENMARGFQEMYRCFLANRMRLLAPDGPLAAAAGQQVRVLARGTLEYILAMNTALHPRRLRRHGLLDVRLRELPPSKTMLAPVRPFELAALQRMDVPRFSIPATAKSLRLAEDCEIPGCFSQSGFERAMAGIRSLHIADMEKQVALIRTAWAFAGLAGPASQ